MPPLLSIASSVSGLGIPTLNKAHQEFQKHGGHITTFNVFGHDLLSHRADLVTKRE